MRRSYLARLPWELASPLQPVSAALRTTKASTFTQRVIHPASTIGERFRSAQIGRQRQLESWEIFLPACPSDSVPPPSGLVMRPSDPSCPRTPRVSAPRVRKQRGKDLRGSRAAVGPYRRSNSTCGCLLRQTSLLSLECYAYREYPMNVRDG
ncbi:hypothetical protein OH77DRAFT_491651 [Trametes cingulata]|nr:hypothetical protein OH77DRAFT_491651 [Trametes cingulata]